VTENPGPSLGDRVERALERHADTAGEIQRGEHEKPRNLRRTVLWMVITLVSLYLVFPKLVEVFSSWHQITRFSVLSLVTMALLQLATTPACGICSGWPCVPPVGGR
jgi:hypothetical protein